MKRQLFKDKRSLYILCIGFAIILTAFSTSEKDLLKSRYMDLFNTIYKELDLLYVDTINPKQTIKAGIEGMLAQLDPYTEFYDEDENEDLEIMTKGTYGGIGSYIVQHGDYVAISEPYEGQAAYQAGLKAGDLILEIDGEDMKGKKNAYVSEKLRGEVGTKFRIKVRRPGEKKDIEREVTRQTIQFPLVPYYGIVRDSIGYINIAGFNGHPSAEVRKAFIELKQKGIKGIIIDIRNNTGGILDEAVAIANIFVPRGETIVSMKGRIRQSEQIYKTTQEPVDTVIPVVVMVNSISASASEILAGAMQDLDRGVIVGKRTFGKGLVQNIRQLPYGGNLKVTIAKYYTPSGRCIQAIDYSHRNEDGSVGRVPDSLTRVFYTKAGRKVRDGGGITPDVEIAPEKFSNNILYYLITENIIFDYATDYCLQHEHIAQADSFSITDADYENFKKRVLDSDFKYDRQSEKFLKSLKEVAEFEGYTETAKAEFEALEKKLQHDPEHDLNYFKKDITDYINYEIIKRYYFQKGGLMQQLKHDEEIDEAAGIINDRARYAQLLSPAKEEATATDRAKSMENE